MKKVIIILLICLLWIGFIFYNSSKNSNISNDKSFIIVHKIEYILKHTFNKTVNENKLNKLIRKCAHVFEYFILSILLCVFISIFNSNNKAVYVLFLGLLTADIDEFYQSFINGRTSHVSDVFIDFAGCLLGTLLYNLIYKKYNNKRQLSQKI